MTTSGRNVAPVLAVVLAALATSSACLRTPEVRYYTLAGERAAEPASRQPVRYTVYVAPASVPEALDRSELVLRLSGTELAIDDTHRWAEPLRTGIARAVAGDLSRQLGGALVSASDDGLARRTTDVEVTIDVQDLEIRLREGAAVQIAWTARWTESGTVRKGRSEARVPSAPPETYDGAVTACAAAIDRVSRDIARSLSSEELSRR